MDQLARALEDHAGVAVPQLDQRECEVERAGRASPLRALDALGVLALVARALRARDELELAGVRLLERRRGALARALGQLEQRRPRLLVELAAQRRGRERLGGGAARRVR